MILNVLLSMLKNKGEWKREPFKVSGTFTAKKTGYHYVSGCGGGAGGTSGGIGGGAGAACELAPVFLLKGQTYTVNIGAGGGC